MGPRVRGTRAAQTRRVFMRFRSRVLLTAGLACLSTAMLAGGALAHGGHNGSKIGKASKKGHAALRVEVRGALAIAADKSTVTITPVGLTPWTCAVPAGSDLSAFTPGMQVRAKCRSAEGKLVLTKLRHTDKADKVKVEVRGTVDPLTLFPNPTSIVVNPNAVGAVTLPLVTCAIGPKTRIKGMLAVGATVWAECKSRDGVLTAKKIKVRKAKLMAAAKAEGVLNLSVPPGFVTVAGITCGVPVGSTLLTGFVQGDLVEIKCGGNPLVLHKIEHEDD